LFPLAWSDMSLPSRLPRMRRPKDADVRAKPDHDGPHDAGAINIGTTISSGAGDVEWWPNNSDGLSLLVAKV